MRNIHAKKKNENSAQKNYYPPSPVYDPSFKEDTLPLFDPLLPALEEENGKTKKRTQIP